ncbi:hypothetical protein Anapl_12000 [Anas platyrhynchos]|uniref:Uncharacterized protein n=1 Tax=Anas platyrhynchos TaxID=8839 RepID=R0LS02_ANAPL|nr:hypothetical protein Anapl_12000 [Anas platyrhynchos]
MHALLTVGGKETAKVMETTTEFITGTSSSEGTFSNKSLFADTRKMSKCTEKNRPVDDIPLAYLTVIFKAQGFPVQTPDLELADLYGVSLQLSIKEMNYNTKQVYFMHDSIRRPDLQFIYIEAILRTAYADPTAKAFKPWIPRSPSNTSSEATTMEIATLDLPPSASCKAIASSSQLSKATRDRPAAESDPRLSKLPVSVQAGKATLMDFPGSPELYRGCQHERIQLWKERIGLKTSSSPGENIGAQSAVLYRTVKKKKSAVPDRINAVPVARRYRGDAGTFVRLPGGGFGEKEPPPAPRQVTGNFTSSFPKPSGDSKFLNIHIDKPAGSSVQLTHEQKRVSNTGGTVAFTQGKKKKF